MLQKPKCLVIAIEEHYWDTELAAYYSNIERNPEVVRRMTDFGELRLKEMDEAGIDIQVISHGAPSMQNVQGDVAVEMGRRVNDRLAAIVAQKPDRFAAFAALPTACSSTTSGSGRFLSARKNSMCRSTCIPRSRCRR